MGAASLLNVSCDLARLCAAMSRACDFAPKVDGGNGIVAPPAAPGVKSGTLPPGLLKLLLILEIESSSKSARSSGASISSDFNYVLVS